MCVRKWESKVCDVNKVSERVNEWCMWESVGPTNVRERKEKKRKKNDVVRNGVCDVNKVSDKVNEWCVCESVGFTVERK